MHSKHHRRKTNGSVLIIAILVAMIGAGLFGLHYWQKLDDQKSTEDYEDKALVCDSGCIGCEDCRNNCPNQAIYMESKHAVIDFELCDDCRMCQYVCPRDVIKGQEVPEYIYRQREAMAAVKEGDINE